MKTSTKTNITELYALFLHDIECQELRGIFATQQEAQDAANPHDIFIGAVWIIERWQLNSTNRSEEVLRIEGEKPIPRSDSGPFAGIIDSAIRKTMRGH